VAFKDIIVGIIIAGLFTLTMFGFMINLETTNDAPNSILNEPAIAELNQSLTERLENVQSDSETQRQNLENQAPEVTGDEGFGLTAIVGTLFTMIGSSFLIVQVLSNSITSIIGIPAIFVNVVIGSLVVIMLILLWRVIKGSGS